MLRVAMRQEQGGFESTAQIPRNACTDPGCILMKLYQLPYYVGGITFLSVLGTMIVVEHDGGKCKHFHQVTHNISH